MSITLTVNGQPRTVDVDADTPLLWVLREELGLPGTKFGCGAGLCGACTIHLDGEQARSCQIPASEGAGKAITTIEGLSGGPSHHAVQAAWIAEQVPQCGYCQPGMIMAVAALLHRTPHPTEAEVHASISNICRCGTYPRVIKAIAHAVAKA